jgi:hypothetical protein
VLALGPAVLITPPAPAQDREPATLLLLVRNSVPDSGGTLDITLTNLSAIDRQARVLVFFEARPNVQYGRDVWVPAHATLSTWIHVGAAPADAPPEQRKIQLLLYDRTGGRERLLIQPDERRIPSLPRPYGNRQLTTAVVVDESPQTQAADPFAPLQSAADEVRELARTFRLACGLSEDLRDMPRGPLLPTPEAFDGIDQVVLGSGRLAHDPAGLKGLRRWLERGGRLWVMLDRVDPDALAPLLGDAFDFRVVDRVGLTAFKIESPPPAPEPPVQQHERPVAFARVLLPPEEQARQTVNGWPALFTRQVGRGRVVFTTLGPPAWFRPRTAADPRAPYESYPALPVPTRHLEAVADELQPARGETDFPTAAVRQVLAGEIGYSVVGRGTVALVLALFLLPALALGIALRRLRRPELLGWLGPAAALGAAAVLLAVGESSRRATAPTVAAAQVIDVIPGTEEAVAHGLFAAYRPDSGPAEFGANGDGSFDLDAADLEGLIRRRILTDMDAWHWDNLALPTGVRFASFRCTTTLAEPIAAVAHFGPDGIEGKLAAGPCRGLADALLSTTGGRNMAVRLGPDGTFRAGGPDVLPNGQFVAGALLSDRQQRRQEMYRELLKRPEISPREGRSVLMAWAEPLEMPFALVPDARTTGTALLVIPLRLERPVAGERVTIPAPLVACRRVLEGARTRPTLESDQAADMHLRFQLPPTVLPLRVERARLACKVNAPGRRVTISGRAGEQLVELHRAESPLDPIRVEIVDERLLRPDDEGGLHLNLDISAPLGSGPRGNEKWTIEYLELEVVGRTE